MGRPPKDPSERLRNRVMASFSDDEYAELMKAAADDGEPVGSVVREMVLRALKGRRRR